MESFYGGRQGTSIVIKGSFKYITDEKKGSNYEDPYYGTALKTINEMPNDTEEAAIAKQNALKALQESTMTVQLNRTDYKDVWYNEYCIIDHPNRNNLNNGKLFRRTLKNAEDNKLFGGVAEYVGQITGPAGIAPQLVDLNGVSQLQTKFDAIKARLGENDVLQYLDGNGNFVTYDPSSDNPSLGLLNFGGNIEYIPGNFSLDEEHYIESGSYGWFNLRQGTDETDESKIYLGFRIPYHVNTFSIGSHLPYTSAPNIDENKQTEFYSNWVISIPRGAPGGYFGDLQKRTCTGNESYTYYLPTDISYNSSNETYVAERNIDQSIYNWAVGQTAYFATFYWYGDIDGNDRGIKQIPNIFLGLAQGIKNITLSNDGEITVFYESDATNDNGQTINNNNPLTWIVKTEVPTSTAGGRGGHLLVQFNNNLVGKTPMSAAEVTEAGLTGGHWYDLGVVREILDGLYVQSGLTANASSEEEIESHGRQALENVQARTNVVQIVDVNLNGETIPTLFYWRANSLGSPTGSWEILGTTGGGGSIGKGAILAPQAGETIPRGALVLLTGQVLSNNNLTTPWA